MPKTEACEVCGAPATCIGSVKFVCKSCSTFYRRSYNQYGTMKCRLDGNCEINEFERTKCRSCRLQKCRDAGLRMVGKNLTVQFNGYPEDDLEDFDEDGADQAWKTMKVHKQEGDRVVEQFAEASSLSGSNFNNRSSTAYMDVSSSTDARQTHSQQHEDIYTADYCIDQAQQLLKEFPNSRYPTLSKLVDAFLQFERRQRFLSAMHQDKDIVDEELTRITYKVQGRMQASTNRIACMFIMEVLAGCDLSREQKISILNKACIQVAMAHKFTLNAPRFFPQLGDTRISTFIGLYYDTQDLSSFFDGLASVDGLVDFIRPMCQAMQKATDKARCLRPTIVEAVFLMAVVLFEEVERQLINNQSVQSVRNRLYADFTAYQINAYNNNSIAAGLRLVRLTSYVHENKVLTLTQEDRYSLAGLFMNDIRDHYNEQLETWDFQYKLGPFFPSKEFVEQITSEGVEM